MLSISVYVEPKIDYLKKNTKRVQSFVNHMFSKCNSIPLMYHHKFKNTLESANVKTHAQHRPLHLLAGIYTYDCERI